MKQFYLSIIAILFFSFAFAAPVNNVITNGGNWSTASTWSLGRIPASGDTVVVPTGMTVDMGATNVTLNNLYIKITGTFTIGNATMSLDVNSTVQIYSGGSLYGTHPGASLQINSVVKYSGKTITINGPAYANSSTGVHPSGFSTGIILPVKFAGFSATATANGNLIQWATAEEINASVYEIERSEDGSTWNTIATVMAVGNSTKLNSYSYTDKINSVKTAYYRIKQVDRDGKFVYTAVKTIKTQSASNPQVKIASTGNSNVVLQFTGEIKGSVLVRLISFSGQVIAQQSYTNPIGQVIFPQSVKGAYIVSVSNAQDIHVAQQVIL